jgi:hypothetical protein
MTNCTLDALQRLYNISLRQLWHFEIVIPPCENACLLDTDDDMIAR